VVEKPAYRESLPGSVGNATRACLKASSSPVSWRGCDQRPTSSGRGAAADWNRPLLLRDHCLLFRHVTSAGISTLILCHKQVAARCTAMSFQRDFKTSVAPAGAEITVAHAEWRGLLVLSPLLSWDQAFPLHRPSGCTFSRLVPGLFQRRDSGRPPARFNKQPPATPPPPPATIAVAAVADVGHRCGPPWTLQLSPPRP